MEESYEAFDDLKAEEERVLGELWAKRNEYDEKIKDAEKEFARKKGELFDSIDDLVKGRGKKFVEFGKIRGSFHPKESGRSLKIYEEDDDKKHKLLRERAYECWLCEGVVLGEVRTVPYSDIGKVPLSRKEGEHYHCRLCNTQLGFHYWVFS